MRQLLDVVQEFAAAPARPGPAAVGGAAGGGAEPAAGPGTSVKSHHSVTDGLGAVQLMAGCTAAPRARPATGPSLRLPRAGTGVAGGAVRRAGHPAGVGPRRLARAAAVGRRRRRPPGRWRRSRAAVPGAARSLVAAAGGGPATGPPRRCWPGGAAAGTSRSSTCRWPTSRPGRKRPAARSTTALLAAVIGGFRRYHERYRGPVDRLTVGFPISLRTQDDPQGGNRFTGADSPRPWPSPTRPPGSPPVREFVLTARAASAAAPDAVDRARPGAQLAARARWSAAHLGPADQHQRRPGVQHPGRAVPGVHRGLADHPHVPVRPAARLRGHDHPALARRGLLHRRSTPTRRRSPTRPCFSGVSPRPSTRSWPCAQPGRRRADRGPDEGKHHRVTAAA